eukprot:10072448-Lingulodinium_polyedra.AAC.1
MEQCACPDHLPHRLQEFPKGQEWCPVAYGTTTRVITNIMALDKLSVRIVLGEIALAFQQQDTD